MALVKHEVEEFPEVLARHGAWHPGLIRFIEVAKEVELPQRTFDEWQRENDDDALMREHDADAAADRVIVDAVERLRPTPGSGIDSVTISSPGLGGTTLHADGRTERSEA